jgi:ubiquilin
MMRQTMEMMRNPAAMQQAMRSQDLAMSQLENHPEGFNALRRMYEEVQEPLMEATRDAAASANTSQSGAAPQTNPWATGEPNTSALPNPWGAPPARGAPVGGAGAANPFASMMGGMGGMPGGMGGMGMPPGMNDPSQIAAMMQNPMVQQMLRDPQMVQQMARMDPNLGRMLEANPQMLQMLSDPETLRRMSDPANIQAMMQMQQAMQTLQGSGMLPPGGLGGMPGGAGGWGAGGNPFLPRQPAPPASGSSTIGGLDFSALLGGAGGMPAAPPAPTRSPEVQYEMQLQQLEGMGFTDRAANIRALIATNGNVNAAIERLLQ